MDVRRLFAVGAAAAVLLSGIATAAISTSLLVAVDAVLLIILLIILRPGVIGLITIAVLGAAPFAAIDMVGYNVPVVVLLAPVAALAALIRRQRHDRPVASQRWTILAAGAVIVTGTLSFLATNGRDGSADALEYTKWLSASLLFVPALCHGRSWVDQARRVFAASTSAGAIFALAATYTSAGPRLMASLGAIGYVRSSDDARYFILNGVSQAQRVTGSYTDPNVAAIFLMCGLAASASIHNRTLRAVARGVLLIGLGGTLSRGAILGAAVAVVAFVVVGRGRWQRALGLTGVALAASVLLAIPTTRDRLLTTGSVSDIGGMDRTTQLSRFPSVMANNWTVGLGFGRPEFRDSTIAYQVDEIADAPLAAVYRGGIVEGVGFAAWYGLAGVLALRLLRSKRPTHRHHGIVLLGFLVAALSGYGTVIIPELVALFTLQISQASVLVASETADRDADTAIASARPLQSRGVQVATCHGRHTLPSRDARTASTGGYMVS
jgi:polysaccharide biosynthesis protein PslJ